MSKFENSLERHHWGFKTCIPVSERKLVTPISITEAHRSEEEYKIFDGTWKALWDTGASLSAVSKTLATRLNLPVLCDCCLNGVGGEYQSKEYLAGLILPNNMPIPSTSLYGCEDSEIFDILIGMDIISMGDFLISVENGNMYFSFQYPSVGGFYLGDIQQAELQNGGIFHRPPKTYISSPKPGRNELCPCGSGKKYKHCCGKNT